MGIREIAAAAKVAEEAAAKAEKKRLWALNAAEAETTVMQLLGVKGKATRAHSDKPRPYGDHSVVELEDDMFVTVRERTHYAPTTRYSYGAPSILGTDAYLLLCDESGSTLTGTLDNDIRSLADLDDALKARDAYLVKKAEYEARRAAATA